MVFFFQTSFFQVSNVHHSFSKLKRILTLMIIKGKTLEIGEIHFEMHMDTLINM
jgi:hypothetical protein